MLGQDGRERNAPSLGQGDAFHLPHDVLLDDAGDDAVPGDGMHLVTEVTGRVNRLYFNTFLDKTHTDDRLDKGFRHALVNPGAAKEVHQLEGVVIAGRRKVMDRPASLDGILDDRIQGPIRLDMAHADAPGE